VKKKGKRGKEKGKSDEREVNEKKNRRERGVKEL
jgi:hypothetical protein